MRIFVLILSLMFPVELVAEEMCGPQSYDTIEEPDFDCPSPGEEGLVPNLSPPASIPVEIGEMLTVPWTGALVHQDRLVEVGLSIKALRRLRWLDRVSVLAEYQIQLEHQEGVCNANIEHANERIEIFRGALDQANENVSAAKKWYRSFGFGFTVGIISAGILTALAAYVVTVL